MNLVEELHKQMDRARELKKLYEDIPGGGFGAALIDGVIKHAEMSLQSGNIAMMQAAYMALEEPE